MDGPLVPMLALGVVVALVVALTVLAVAFRYRYFRRRHSSTRERWENERYAFHVMALGLPVALTSLELAPATVATRLVGRLGGRDAERGPEAFDRAWRVRCADPRFASDVLHPRMRDRLRAADALGANLRVEGASVLSWERGEQPPSVIDARLRLLADVVALVPRAVWQDHGYDPG